ncbi:hypothetical protein SAMN06264346_11551 [Chryseobacterium profundimaris]|uniref:Uncharacterized protein n=1 Tax=Chryseobacterium profundimaris TaxID=1387275 RepID=A0ABY1PFM3_9FLAO|nr:hypothetical protein SAMN06264346_11551 [Chryseobacterium profundimaris]
MFTFQVMEFLLILNPEITFRTKQSVSILIFNHEEDIWGRFNTNFNSNKNRVCSINLLLQNLF